MQQVWLPPSSSVPQPVAPGVPQGSYLSPLLFNIYVTPLVYLAEGLEAKVIAYADDTQLFFTWGKDADSISSAQHCSVFKWLAAAQLKCNEEKSEILIYGNFPPKFRDMLWPLGFPLPTSKGNSAKTLGVWFEDNLSFATQFKKLAGTCFRLLKTLRKFLPLLQRPAKEMVIRALILSRLDYANVLYISIPGYLLNKLQVVQNAASRLLLDLPIRSSVRLHLRSLHWLPVAVQVKFKTQTIAHRALYGQGPIYLQKRFSFYVPLRQLRSSSQLLAQVPRFTRHRMGGGSFVLKAALAWNALPLALCNIQGSVAFKKKLKTFLFV